MPPIGERMASVETALGIVQSDVSDIRSDVKSLVKWMTEERAAKRQRQLSRKALVGLISALSGVAGFVGAVLARVL